MMAGRPPRHDTETHSVSSRLVTGVDSTWQCISSLWMTATPPPLTRWPSVDSARSRLTMT